MVLYCIILYYFMLFYNYEDYESLGYGRNINQHRPVTFSHLTLMICVGGREGLNNIDVSGMQ
jgi:hypothetical protein